MSRCPIVSNAYDSCVTEPESTQVRTHETMSDFGAEGLVEMPRNEVVSITRAMVVHQLPRLDQYLQKKCNTTIQRRTVQRCLQCYDLRM